MMSDDDKALLLSIALLARVLLAIAAKP